MNPRKRVAEMLEPDRTSDRTSRALNLFLILLISMNVIAIILESVDPIYQKYQQNFWYFEVFSVAIFTIEYLARVWSCVELEGTSESSPITGRIRYMLTPIALIDLIAILPFYMGLYLTIDLRFLRGLRLLRLFKLTRYSPALVALLDVVQQESEALLAAMVVLVIMLVMAASGIYLLESDLQPETFGSIPSSMWWSIVTLTTLGYGDVVPITAMGKTFAGLIGLIGIGMIALPAAILASGFAENIRGRKQKYNQYVQHFLEDGVIDDNERWKLEELRRELGLESDDALRTLQHMMRQAKRHDLTQCPSCGERLD